MAPHKAISIATVPDGPRFDATAPTGPFAPVLCRLFSAAIVEPASSKRNPRDWLGTTCNNKRNAETMCQVSKYYCLTTTMERHWC